MTVETTPAALRLHARSRALEVEWPDGTCAALPFRFLRERCMCAECRSARSDGAAISALASIAVTALPCGAGAVQLVFSDGHSRGIFPFAYLRELATLVHST